eukprot:ANDGO_08373.mRNA.1 Putative SWI/SNF-related matrix-associated actin-dependent regulator of chromatin subfamily A member 3-like 2
MCSVQQTQYVGVHCSKNIDPDAFDTLESSYIRLSYYAPISFYSSKRVRHHLSGPYAGYELSSYDLSLENQRILLEYMTAFLREVKRMEGFFYPLLDFSKFDQNGVYPPSRGTTLYYFDNIPSYLKAPDVIHISFVTSKIHISFVPLHGFSLAKFQTIPLKVWLNPFPLPSSSDCHSTTDTLLPYQSAIVNRILKQEREMKQYEVCILDGVARLPFTLHSFSIHSTVLCCPPGTGKTRIACSIIGTTTQPCLIVCPPQVILQWKNELNRMNIQLLEDGGYVKLVDFAHAADSVDLLTLPDKVKFVVIDEFQELFRSSTLTKSVGLETFREEHKAFLILISATPPAPQSLPDCCLTIPAFRTDVSSFRDAVLKQISYAVSPDEVKKEAVAVGLQFPEIVCCTHFVELNKMQRLSYDLLNIMFEVFVYRVRHTTHRLQQGYGNRRWVNECLEALKKGFKRIDFVTVPDAMQGFDTSIHNGKLWKFFNFDTIRTDQLLWSFSDPTAFFRSKLRICNLANETDFKRNYSIQSIAKKLNVPVEDLLTSLNIKPCEMMGKFMQQTMLRFMSMYSQNSREESQNRRKSQHSGEADDGSCPICLDEFDPSKSYIILHPCGHFLCRSCSMYYTSEDCPMCRTFIEDRKMMTKDTRPVVSAHMKPVADAPTVADAEGFGKVRALVDLLQTFTEGKKSSVVHCETCQAVDFVRVVCEQNHIPHMIYRPGDNPDVLERFKTAVEKSPHHLLCTSVSGIDFPTVKAAVMFATLEKWITKPVEAMEDEIQFMCRVRRLGSQEKVEFHRFVTRGTVEEILFWRVWHRYSALM